MLQELQDDIAQWSDQTFGSHCRLQGMLAHLRKEVQELSDHPDDTAELADCFMLLLDISRSMNVDTHQLIQETRNKLEINKQRRWGEPGPDGEVEHLRIDASSQSMP